MRSRYIGDYFCVGVERDSTRVMVCSRIFVARSRICALISSFFGMGGMGGMRFVLGLVFVAEFICFTLETWGTLTFNVFAISVFPSPCWSRARIFSVLGSWLFRAILRQ